MKTSYVLPVLVLMTAAAAFAGPVVVDGVFSPGEWGTPVAHLTPYVDSVAPPTQNVLLYWDPNDPQRVYGAIVGDPSLPYAFPTANIYVYSSSSSFLPDGTPGVYGDGNDIIIESGNRWHFSLNADPWAGPDHLLPMTLSGTIYSGSDGLVSLAYDTSTLVTEFSIDRSLLGHYDRFRYGGQLFAYEFNTGGSDRQPGAMVPATPEPATWSLFGLGAAAALVVRRYRK